MTRASPSTSSDRSDGAPRGSAGQRVRERGERNVVAVGDLHVAVVELFVTVRDPAGGELLDEDARPEVQVPLVLDPAVDEEETQRADRGLVAADEARGVPGQPPRPDLLAQAPRPEIKRQRDAELARGIG